MYERTVCGSYIENYPKGVIIPVIIIVITAPNISAESLKYDLLIVIFSLNLGIKVQVFNVKKNEIRALEKEIWNIHQNVSLLKFSQKRRA